MIRLDEDALICDFAETYHIFDYRSLPVKLAATLAAGLRDSSRIRMKASGMKAPPDQIFLAALIDSVEALRYGFTEDARKGKNKPESIAASLTGGEKKKESGYMTFKTAEEFEEALARIRGA